MLAEGEEPELRGLGGCVQVCGELGEAAPEAGVAAVVHRGGLGLW